MGISVGDCDKFTGIKCRMNTDVETYIRDSYPWSKLPGNVRQVGKINAPFFDTLIMQTGQTCGGHLSEVTSLFSPMEWHSMAVSCC